MDWNLAIERNREALKRIVAMLVAMTGLGNGHSAIAGRQSESEPAQAADGPATPDGQLPTADCRVLLPRHLHRAILRLLRPAESAARRLVIVMARGLVVALPARVHQRKPRSKPTFLRKPGGTGILMPRGSMSSTRPAPRTLALPLFDPLRPFRTRPKRPAANGIPRISFPGLTALFPITPRRPPAPDDPLDATRLALRLQALRAALDDLPGQARRFARWKAARRRDAVGAQNKKQHAGRIRRVWPLRPGRPPGQRPANRRTHEVHEILNDLHGLAFDVLEHPDTS
jgi:hypothetical protein